MIGAQVDRFAYYLRERETVRELKESGAPAPWTSDEILSTWKFCNVNRSDDKATRWLDFYMKNHLMTIESALFTVITYRLFNKIETGQTLRDNFLFDVEWWDAEKAIREIKKQDQFIGSAYRIAAPAGDKVEALVSVADYVHKNIEELTQRMLAADTMDGKLEVLTSIPYIGNFTGYQMLVDLVDTELGYAGAETFDWAKAGPGAVRGLNRLFGRPVDEVSTKYDYMQEMRDVRAALEERGIEFTYLMDVQHNLCEIDKYNRVLEGGRMKVRYNK